ncbi:MAG: hypothetical protein HFJ27_04590 [Clostridia bacterium]|nr:hypothetical protein [Clostridia bacterium]
MRVETRRYATRIERYFALKAFGKSYGENGKVLNKGGKKDGFYTATVSYC